MTRPRPAADRHHLVWALLCFSPLLLAEAWFTEAYASRLAQRRTVVEGAKGLIVYEFTHNRVTLFFRWHVKFRLGDKALALTVSQARRLLERILPLKILTLIEVLQWVKRTQQRNHQAYLAQRKQRAEGGETRPLVSSNARSCAHVALDRAC